MLSQLTLVCTSATSHGGDNPAHSAAHSVAAEVFNLQSWRPTPLRWGTATKNGAQSVGRRT